MRKVLRPSYKVGLAPGTGGLLDPGRRTDRSGPACDESGARRGYYRELCLTSVPPLTSV
jgi:hypothetical protein